MKHYLSFIQIVILAVITITVTSCKDPLGITEPQLSSQEQKFLKITKSSASVNSFAPNYNEQEAMTIAGALGKDLYPIRIGQKMTLTDESLKLTKDSTTAIGTLVQKYDGKLIIQGTFQLPTIGIRSKVDTTIQKSFSTTITRIIQYKKVSNTGNDTLDWKVDGVSLANGGTTGNNIQIVKLTLTAQDGSEVVITDPNAFFFKTGKEKERDENDEDDDNHDSEKLFAKWGQGWNGLMTWYGKDQSVSLKVEVLSKSSDPDLLTVTYGAALNGSIGTKEKFDLVSSVSEGSYYRKVYQRKVYTHSNSVRMHAVINAFTRNSAYDTDASVESKTWGIPYRVK